MHNRASLTVLATVFALAMMANQARGQGFRPPSMAGIVSLIRFQNTACHNDQEESGTCLAEAECNRRAGINIGACANGYGSCCSFKVSLNLIDCHQISWNHTIEYPY